MKGNGTRPRYAAKDHRPTPIEAREVPVEIRFTTYPLPGF